LDRVSVTKGVRCQRRGEECLSNKMRRSIVRHRYWGKSASYVVLTRKTFPVKVTWKETVTESTGLRESYETETVKLLHPQGNETGLEESSYSAGSGRQKEHFWKKAGGGLWADFKTRLKRN